MLGHNKRLEGKLRERGGIRAWATVLESKKEWASTGGVNVAPGQAGSMTSHQQLKLRVEPEGETPFESTVKQVFNDSYGWHIPQEGYSSSKRRRRSSSERRDFGDGRIGVTGRRTVS